MIKTMVQVLKSIKIICVYSCDYKLTCVNGNVAGLTKSYFDEDAISKFVSGMIDDSVVCHSSLIFQELGIYNFKINIYQKQ